jgi:hypothetical protein
VGSRIVVENVNSILFFFELLCHTIQLLTADSGGDRTPDWKKISINCSSDAQRTLNISVLECESTLGVATPV